MLKSQISIVVTLLIVFLIIPVAGHSQFSESLINTDLIHRKVRSQYPFLYVFAKEVIPYISTKKKITIVDVRPKDNFIRLHIPGSIQLPLYFIKTRQFLKNQEIILVDKGYTGGLLEKTCRDLRKNGYMVSILHGGINSWYQNKGPVEGKDPFFKTEFNKISSHEFFQGKDFEDQLIIDVSEKRIKASKELIPYSISIPFSNDRKLFLIKITDEITRMSRGISPLILIYNTQGKQYRQIERVLSGGGLQNVFFLKDGVLGYKKYLRSLSLSFKPQEKRIHRPPNRCGSCAGE